MQNITLRNIYSDGNLLPPGIIRCNETNACHNIEFDNVQSHGWWESLGWGYITEYTYGSNKNSYPVPELSRDSEKVFSLYTVDHFFEFLAELIVAYKHNEADV